MKIFFIIVLSICFLNSCTDMEPIGNENSLAEGKGTTRSVNAPSFEFPEINWAAYDTHAQKVAACQIPDSILSNIPTAELVGICMEYPLLFDAYAFNTPLQGIKVVASRFNGLQELMTREDNFECILAYLKGKDVRTLNFATLSLAEEGRLLLSYSLCEYLLSFAEVIRHAPTSAKEEAAQYAQAVLTDKESDNRHFSMNDLTSSLYLWASTVSDAKVQTRGSTESPLDKFLRTGEITSMEEYATIKQQCLTH